MAEEEVKLDLLARQDVVRVGGAKIYALVKAYGGIASNFVTREECDQAASEVLEAVSTYLAKLGPAQ